MMKRFPWLAAVWLGCSMHVLAAPSQAVLNSDTTKVLSQLDRSLYGRFLHITDIHPDAYYTKGSSSSTQCHRPDPHDECRAGYYGTPFSDCDSPLTLTNFTFDFLDYHWSSDIDFVIWTGDNARHDEDDMIPRPLDEIFDLNRAVAKKMEDVFVRKGIPVVPSLGNNDVWPHNTLSPGPNQITNEFASIWDAFLPSCSESFRQGAYYAVDVIPDALAAISLNTMYFYHNNKAVGGCLFGNTSDPGNLHFEWLEEQLEIYRARQVQVWITGHIPPSTEHYFPECYYRYTELSLRYQDIILGSLFGHLNVDHFYYVEAADLNIGYGLRPQSSKSGSIFDDLMARFEALPKTSEHLDYDDYGIVSVSPSLVPNPYLPTFRVFSYNISGLQSSSVGGIGGDEYFQRTKMDRAMRWKNLPYRHGNRGKNGAECGNAGYRDSWRCKDIHPWRADSHAPSRQNSLWTPLGYAQYYMPKLDKYDKRHEPKFKLEYLTYAPSKLHPTDNVTQAPVPMKNLPRSLRAGGVTKSKFAPYGLGDLTIPSWLDLACRLGKPREKKLRKLFRKYMYMGGEES